jgi:purine-binding chemotaxis protein CheW
MSSVGNRDKATDGFVTVMIEGQLFGLSLERVRDVFVPQGLSPVPLAPPEVAGLLNLRGRIVTALDLRRRLGLPNRAAGKPTVAVGIEERGELYGLIADRVGDVLWLESSRHEASPANLDPRWAQVCSGVYQLDGRLLVALDIDKVLDFSKFGAAA